MRQRLALDGRCNSVGVRAGDVVRCGSGFDTVYVARVGDAEIAHDCESIVTVTP